MKLRMSHYNHKIILDAKFDSGSSFSFLDMPSQNFPQKKGTSEASNSIIYPPPRKTDSTQKKSVMSIIVLLDPKLTLYLNFSNFQVEEHFSFSKSLGCPGEKRAAATKIWSEHVLRIKAKSRKVWAS